jgi:hypothetical protein
MSEITVKAIEKWVQELVEHARRVKKLGEGRMMRDADLQT